MAWEAPWDLGAVRVRLYLFKIGPSSASSPSAMFRTDRLVIRDVVAKLNGVHIGAMVLEITANKEIGDTLIVRVTTIILYR